METALPPALAAPGLAADLPWGLAFLAGLFLLWLACCRLSGRLGPPPPPPGPDDFGG